MVSFQCDGCADTVKKPQLDKHRQRCWSSFTCLDCSTTFSGTDYKSHTSCISEAEKYQGALYKGAKKNGGHAGNQQPNNRYQPYPPSKPASAAPVLPLADAAATAPLDTSANPSTSSTPAPTPTIHPSRAKLLPNLNGHVNGNVGSSIASPSESTAKSYQRGGARGAQAFPPLHPPAQYSPKPPTNGYRGGPNAGTMNRGPNRKELTGMNTLGNPGGMRSWGTTPVGSAEGSANGDADGVGAGDATVEGGEGKKNKKKKAKKGDKGGTGSRAGISSKVPAAAVLAGKASGGAPSASGSSIIPAETSVPAAPTSTPSEQASSSIAAAANPISLDSSLQPPKPSAADRQAAKAEKKARREAERTSRPPKAEKEYPAVVIDPETGKVKRNKDKYNKKHVAAVAAALAAGEEPPVLQKKAKKVKKPEVAEPVEEAVPQTVMEKSHAELTAKLSEKAKSVAIKPEVEPVSGKKQKKDKKRKAEDMETHAEEKTDTKEKKTKKVKKATAAGEKEKVE